MVKKIKTKDSGLEVILYDSGEVEIESSKFSDVSIVIKPVDPTNPLTPLGAIYKGELYQGKGEKKLLPFEYDGGWILSNGKILKRGKEYSDYITKQKELAKEIL
ncbi:MAG: hypothetical protein AABX88_02445 [Nanoarchaeota archaeon]